MFNNRLLVDAFDTGTKLGKGEFGIAHKGKHKATRIPVLLKRIPIEKVANALPQKLLVKISALETTTLETRPYHFFPDQATKTLVIVFPEKAYEAAQVMRSLETLLLSWSPLTLDEFCAALKMFDGLKLNVPIPRTASDPRKSPAPDFTAAVRSRGKSPGRVHRKVGNSSGQSPSNSSSAGRQSANGDSRRGRGRESSRDRDSGSSDMDNYSEEDRKSNSETPRQSESAARKSALERQGVDREALRAKFAEQARQRAIREMERARSSGRRSRSRPGSGQSTPRGSSGAASPRGSSRRAKSSAAPRDRDSDSDRSSFTGRRTAAQIREEERRRKEEAVQQRNAEHEEKAEFIKIMLEEEAKLARAAQKELLLAKEQRANERRARIEEEKRSQKLRRQQERDSKQAEVLRRKSLAEEREREAREQAAAEKAKLAAEKVERVEREKIAQSQRRRRASIDRSAQVMERRASLQLSAEEELMQLQSLSLHKTGDMTDSSAQLHSRKVSSPRGGPAGAPAISPYDDIGHPDDRDDLDDDDDDEEEL